MTGSSAATTTVDRHRALDDDARQLIAVLAMAAVSLVLGFALMQWTMGQTRTVEAQDLTAAVPPGWIAQEGVGDVVLVAYDPGDTSLRYSVSRPRAAASVAEAADLRIAARNAVLPAFSVLERTAATVSGTPGEQVTSTWAGEQPGDPVRSMQGRDLLVPSAATVLVITLESPSESFDDALPDFERFAASVKVKG